MSYINLRLIALFCEPSMESLLVNGIFEPRPLRVTRSFGCDSAADQRKLTTLPGPFVFAA
jgi:hypothetical protein